MCAASERCAAPQNKTSQALPPLTPTPMLFSRPHAHHHPAQVDAPFLLRALGERTPEQLLAAAAPVSELTCVCVAAAARSLALVSRR